MEVTIEQAKSEDFLKIKELNNKLFIYEDKHFDVEYNMNWPEQNEIYYKDSINDETACTLVAKSQGKIVGYLIGSIWKKQVTYRTFRERAEVENMFVEESFRSFGVGNETF